MFRYLAYLSGVKRVPDVRDEVDHVEAHLDTVVSVTRIRDWNPGHAVVAVAQDLDPHAVVSLECNTERLKSLEAMFLEVTPSDPRLDIASKTTRSIGLPQTKPAAPRL